MVEFSSGKRILRRSANRLAGDPTKVYFAGHTPHLSCRHVYRYAFLRLRQSLMSLSYEELSQDGAAEVTQVLRAAGAGDPEASAKLLPLVSPAGGGIR